MISKIKFKLLRLKLIKHNLTLIYNFLIFGLKSNLFRIKLIVISWLVV